MRCPHLLQILIGKAEDADIYLSGCFGSQGQTSIAHNVLQLLSIAPQRLCLRLFFVGMQNTLACGAPRFQSLFVETVTGQAFGRLEADVLHHLPHFHLREAAGLVHPHAQLRQIYNAQHCCLRLQAPDVAWLPAKQLACLEQWLGMDDAQLLQVSSTSPEYERPSYAAGMLQSPHVDVLQALHLAHRYLPVHAVYSEEGAAFWACSDHLQSTLGSHTCKLPCSWPTDTTSVHACVDMRAAVEIILQQARQREYSSQGLVCQYNTGLWQCRDTLGASI